ncbi:hypothetical protein RJT34_17967 [Clitoria ternatea]|uniref:Bowman-Birk serine protease inhibitors family domain-containing protein n=1 Tax=Clitoria ternatea TaxID=43366 RepID=A0AAN9JB58_CLITE
MAMVKIAMVIFVLGIISMATVSGDGGFEATNPLVESRSRPCCNHCVCTKSIPPQCRCTDVGKSCHSACKSCLCTKSNPPTCHCTDIKSFCYKPCHSNPL